jgi:hypothetical protein
VSYRLTDRAVEQRRQAATVHGARSQSAVAAQAKPIERQFLREQKLKRSDLDGIALGYLHGYAIAMAKVSMYDEHSSLVGSREYIAALNAGRLWLGKLEARLRVLGRDHARPPGAALEQHLRERYGDRQ